MEWIVLMELSLKEWLDKNEINYKLHIHPAVFTVDEARIHCYSIPGLHCKNLLLKDTKSKKYYLVTLPASKKVELSEIKKRIGAKKLSFVKPETLKDILNLEPGSVSPFGLVNDETNRVTYIIDREVWNAEKTCFHPNINTETLELKREDFQKAINAMNNEYQEISIE
jgi:Ala-tRNA(Pro) deacylase